ncbi:DUF499 domain-containing protein [Fibrella sp. ES10-3-2-2]|nr:hypothetical protein A6C57_08615 [Fibrella sp. ES10-3-2-2]
MRSLSELLTPRSTVFDKAKRDTVLDLTDLMVDGKIKPNEFFDENFITEGLKALYEGVFRRFEGKSDDGIFRLTQTMGGGKTHAMIATALLAQYPQYREKVMSGVYKTTFEKPVQVVAFSGRESDMPLGIWGYIAEKLGKKDQLRDYYGPLKAPGQTTWINLLKGEPLLILLDELPPYFDAAEATQIGNSNLAKVTATALTNLLSAVGKDELKNVCVVISDLTANYAAGRAMMATIFNDLTNEIGRVARDFTPVRPNSDELYLILRKRLFENEAPADDIKAISDAYGDSMKQAKQMDLTTENPDAFAANIRESFPFHPGIKELFARFKDNPGFQQTRGSIRLMRTFMARMFDPATGWADQRHLIHAHDFDLTDADTLSMLQGINPQLSSAIDYDICRQNGSAIAQQIDAQVGTTTASETARLLLLSSLTTLTGGLKGMTEADIVRNIVRPGQVPASIKNDALIPLTTRCWYLHTDREGRSLFKDAKNVVAQLTSISQSYNEESIRTDLIKYIKDLFNPTRKDVYQKVYALPSLDEVSIDQDQTALLIYMPYDRVGLNPELQRFYDEQTYKNRLMFLSGDNKSLVAVNQNAGELKAIKYILEDMRTEKVATNSPEFVQAEDLEIKIKHNFLSAVQQTFVKLWYPHSQGLKADNFSMQFSGSSYIGEDQIRATLTSGRKFITDEPTGDLFRKQAEIKLFGSQKNQPWADIRRKAAMDIKWPWHKPNALDQLKDAMLHQDQWRSSSNWIEIGPFPLPQTDLRFQQVARDTDTGEVILKLQPVHGDEVYYEIGAVATTASARVADLKNFVTTELEISFLCHDSTGEHETGPAVTWNNQITLKYDLYDKGGQKMLELKAAPNALIRYTTDGSNPLTTGGTYTAPLAVPPATRLVLAIAEKKGIQSNALNIDIDWKAAPNTVTLNKQKPARWNRTIQFDTTQKTYDFLTKMDKAQVNVVLAGAAITGIEYVELMLSEKLSFKPAQIQAAIDALRTNLYADGQVTLDVRALLFPDGQALEEYAQELRIDLKSHEIEQ